MIVIIMYNKNVIYVKVMEIPNHWKSHTYKHNNNNLDEEDLHIILFPLIFFHYDTIVFLFCFSSYILRIYR